MNKHLKRLIYIFNILISYYLFIRIKNIRICPFFYLFNIPCIGCGLTRSFKYLLKLDIIKSISYNILTIPIIIILLLTLILSIYEEITKKNIIDNLLIKYQKQIIIISIIIFVITFIININNPLLY